MIEVTSSTLTLISKKLFIFVKVSPVSFFFFPSLKDGWVNWIALNEERRFCCSFTKLIALGVLFSSHIKTETGLIRAHFTDGQAEAPRALVPCLSSHPTVPCKGDFESISGCSKLGCSPVCAYLVVNHQTC